MITLSAEVQDAMDTGAPVVALESTVYSTSGCRARQMKPRSKAVSTPFVAPAPSRRLPGCSMASCEQG